MFRVFCERRLQKGSIMSCQRLICERCVHLLITVSLQLMDAAASVLRPAELWVWKWRRRVSICFLKKTRLSRCFCAIVCTEFVDFYRATVCNATHGIAMSEISVRLSIKRVDCEKTKETCAHILIPHERSFILVF